MRFRAALCGAFGLLAALYVVLGGCYGPPVIPVSERSTSPVPPEQRIVRRGDTLYNIAWETDLDYRDIAAWNNLTAPFVIRPGQNLRLRPAESVATAVPESPAPPATAQATASGSRDTPAATRPAPAAPLPAKVSSWSWPSDGEVIARYAAGSGRKGIDIAAAAGSPVRAAAPGEVVYAGNGLRGYGQLTIIKHSSEFLSAYAHQRTMLISEGDSVNAGQIIGEIGATGTDRPKLHFEIRRHGKPVDPMDYLPARRG